MPGQRRGRGGAKNREKQVRRGDPPQRPKTQPHSTPVSDQVTVTAGPNACKKQEEVFLGGEAVILSLELFLLYFLKHATGHSKEK